MQLTLLLTTLLSATTLSRAAAIPPNSKLSFMLTMEIDGVAIANSAITPFGTSPQIFKLETRDHTDPEKHEADEQKDKASAEQKEEKEQENLKKADEAAKKGDSAKAEKEKAEQEEAKEQTAKNHADEAEKQEQEAKASEAKKKGGK